MRYRSGWMLAAIMCSMAAAECGAKELGNANVEAFRSGIHLIGCKKSSDPDASLVQTIAPDGTSVGEVIRLGNSPILSGRLSPDGKYIGYSNDDGLWLIDSRGQSQKIADETGFITAWSRDSKRLAFHRQAEDDNEGTWQSFVIDVASGQQTKLPLTGEYVAEDWHPNGDLRTAIYMNSTNRFQRRVKGDWYPLRQLGLFRAGGRIVPFTEPKSDNIWSRFSLGGDRIAHYRRRFLGERPYEYVVVCDSDGTDAEEVFGFTEAGRKDGVYSYKPQGFPAWSPDEKSIAWLAINKRRDDSTGSPELVIIQADGRGAQRIQLADLGLKWVSAIDWR